LFGSAAERSTFMDVSFRTSVEETTVEAGAPLIGSARDNATDPLVYVVDDESEVRKSIGFFLKASGFLSRPYLSGADFLADAVGLAPGCVLLDLRMPDMDGLQVLDRLRDQARRLPVIVMTGHGDIATAVRAMKLGAIDFLEKPFEGDMMMTALRQGFALIEHGAGAEQERLEAEGRLAALSAREREVLSLLSEGKSNKEVAIALDLSVRTVEMHRATMFDRLGVRTLPEAMKIAFRARADLSATGG
jgi:two-component system, LuxR family, response regulator FixJ